MLNISSLFYASKFRRSFVFNIGSIDRGGLPGMGPFTDK